MFGFEEMAYTREERKVSNDVVNGATIDTCAVTDSDQPYETGIKADDYNGGSWVIVEMYETRELAVTGHKKWVEMFKTKKPESLKDVSTSEIKKILDSLQATE